ncbi:MAG: hypothetical protein WCO26_17350 [Deltaproteobacteria bacterium]
MAKLLAAVPTVWPSPEPVSTGVYNMPIWDTHTVTIVDGEPMERTITATWPGPEPHPEAVVFDKLTIIGSPVVYARWSGPWPIMTIHAWSFWLCPQSVKIDLRPSQHLYGFPIPNDYLGFLQPLFLNLQVWFESEGILPRRPASYYLESWELPPMPPTDEEITQLEAQFPPATLKVWLAPVVTSTGVHTITVPVNTATAWDESVPLTYEP